MGALDGKHLAIRHPRRSGSRYYNGFYSVVLLALKDAGYRFVWADVGSNGCCSDAQIFSQRLPAEAGEDNNYRQVPAAWRQGQVLPYLGVKQRENHATVQGHL